MANGTPRPMLRERRPHGAAPPPAVSIRATPLPHRAAMNFLIAASRFNRLCPKGTPVELTLANGVKVRTKTKAPAFVWGEWALVEVEGREGCYQVEYVRPLDAPGPAANAP